MRSIGVRAGSFRLVRGRSRGGHRLAVRDEGTNVVIHDGSAPITPGAGCQSIGADEVSCPSGTSVRITTADGVDVVMVAARTGVVPLTVDLGDGDDHFIGSATAAGGAGDDVLEAGQRPAILAGGPGVDTLVGGPGADRLDGGPGDDTLRGGSGDDSLNVGDAAPHRQGNAAPPPAIGDDQADGGPGRDRLSYLGRTSSVRVDLQDGRPEGARASVMSSRK